jgi:hypothetical protein
VKKHFCIVSIESGKITTMAPFVKMLWELKDGKYEIAIRSLNKRSLNQNSYYWLIMTDYIQPGLYNAGWSSIKTKEAAHEFVAGMFLKVKLVNESTGEMTERVRSTTELNKTEFNVYLEEIWQWAAEYLGVAIPSPNQQFVLYE